MPTEKPIMELRYPRSFLALLLVGFMIVALPLIAGLLATFGIPPEGIGIVLGADRILDMTRTMTNVGSDMITTMVVDAQMQAADAASVARKG